MILWKDRLSVRLLLECSPHFPDKDDSFVSGSSSRGKQSTNVWPITGSPPMPTRCSGQGPPGEFIDDLVCQGTAAEITPIFPREKSGRMIPIFTSPGREAGQFGPITAHPFNVANETASIVSWTGMCSVMATTFNSRFAASFQSPPPAPDKERPVPTLMVLLPRVSCCRPGPRVYLLFAVVTLDDPPSTDTGRISFTAIECAHASRCAHVALSPAFYLRKSSCASLHPDCLRHRVLNRYPAC